MKKNNHIANMKRVSQNINNLTDKTLLVKNITNQINESRSPIYIKDRNKLIVKMLLSGFKPSEIVNLKKDNFQNLKIKEQYKKELQEFVDKYFKHENQEYIFLDVRKRNIIKTATINQIKKRYINNKI